MNILAYFDRREDAKKAKQVLEENRFSCLMDPAERNPVNPDISISELMVGFLPDLNHAIFGSGRTTEKEDGVFLLAMTDDPDRVEIMRDLLIAQGARLVGRQ